MGDVSVAIEVAAPAEAVYDLVAELPRMGEWSPECEHVEWKSPSSGAEVGAEFVGHNRNGWHRWSTHGTVTVADRGREFAFEVRSVFDLPVSRWSYRFEAAAGSGCRVTESTRDRRGALMKVLGVAATGIGDRDARNRATMIRTLEQLRAAAQATPGPASASS